RGRQPPWKETPPVERAPGERALGERTPIEQRTPGERTPIEQRAPGERALACQFAFRWAPPASEVCPSAPSASVPLRRSPRRFYGAAPAPSCVCSSWRLPLAPERLEPPGRSALQRLRRP